MGFTLPALPAMRTGQFTPRGGQPITVGLGDPGDDLARFVTQESLQVHPALRLLQPWGAVGGPLSIRGVWELSRDTLNAHTDMLDALLGGRRSRAYGGNIAVLNRSLGRSYIAQQLVDPDADDETPVPPALHVFQSIVGEASSVDGNRPMMLLERISNGSVTQARALLELRKRVGNGAEDEAAFIEDARGERFSIRGDGTYFTRGGFFALGDAANLVLRGGNAFVEDAGVVAVLGPGVTSDDATGSSLAIGRSSPTLAQIGDLYGNDLGELDIQGNVYNYNPSGADAYMWTRAFIFDAKATRPTVLTAGRRGLWVKTTDNLAYYWDGTTDTAWGSGGGGSPHDLLDGSQNQDTLAGSVVLGDLIHGNATPKWARIAGNTTTTRKFFNQTGNGTISAVPAWSALVAGDIPDISASYVPVARTITASSPLTGGGDLSANRSIGLGTVGIANGGTGQTGKAAAFDALAPTTTQGDMIYANATPTNTAIAIGNANDILRVASGIPQWCSAATWLAAVGNFTNVAADTITGSWSTNTTYTILSSRVGDVLKCYLNIKLAGAPTSATLTLNIPGGRTVDATKLARTAGQNERAYIGAGYDGDTGTANRPTFQLWYDFTSNHITVNYLSAITASAPVGASVTQAAPQTWASGDWMSLTFELPISGWSF